MTEPLSRPHGAAGKGQATRRFMSNLDSLTFASKQNSVVTDNIATAHCGKADSLVITRPGLAFSSIDSHFFQVATYSGGD